MSLVLITSLIKTPNTPLSYTNTRSVYSHNERYEQVKRSIQSIRENIPDAKILLIECSDLDQHQKEYFQNNCEYFLNLFDYDNKIIYLSNVHSKYKTLGELTLTIEAIKYIKKNNIQFQHFFKLSGRYWLNEHFDLNKFLNNKCYLYGNNHVLVTCLYKLDYDYLFKWFNYLINQHGPAVSGYSMENFLSNFISDNLTNNILITTQNYGVSGNIAVDGFLINF